MIGAARSPLAALAAGSEVEIEAEGGSMFPLIRNGARVRVAPLGPGDPRLGDIVLAVIGGRWVLHRVVALDGDRLTLQGDNRSTRDAAVARSAVAGVAVEVAGRVGDIPLRWSSACVAAWLRLTPLTRRAAHAAERVRRLSRGSRSA